VGLSALLAVLIGAGMLSAWELPSPPSERRSRGQVQEHIVACASRSSCQLRRSETSCHAAEAITQNSLNGVVRYQVVRAPAGNEAISPRRHIAHAFRRRPRDLAPTLQLTKRRRRHLDMVPSTQSNPLT
jgi:hypothetical protein